MDGNSGTSLTGIAFPTSQPLSVMYKIPERSELIIPPICTEPGSHVYHAHPLYTLLPNETDRRRRLFGGGDGGQSDVCVCVNKRGGRSHSLSAVRQIYVIL